MTTLYKLNKTIKRNRDLTFILVMYFGISCLFYAVLTGVSAYEKGGIPIRTVQAVCDYAHSKPYDGGSEEACGIAQEESGTKYTCDSTKLDAHCWVETK